MKALYIVSAYSRSPGDVITPWLVQTIHRLRERRVDVEVLAPSYRGLATQELEGVRVHRFRYAPRRWETLTHDQTAPDRIREHPGYLGLVPSYVLSSSLRAARLARSGEFQVIHAFWPLPHGLIGLVARKLSGVPLVSTFFGVELTWMESQLPFLRPVLQRIVRGSDAVTTISTYTADRLRRNVPEAEPVIIPFGAAVEPPDQTEPVGEERPVRPFELLFVGRLVERKGVHVLLDALARLSDRGDVLLHVVGDGPERGRLEARATALGISERVRFTGTVSEQQLVEHLTRCDALVLPAVVDAKGDTEGLGVVLIEAMSYGKPVIGSAVGGIVDVVQHERNGLLVPSADAGALAEAISTLVDDPARAQVLGRRGREDVKLRFSWPAITDRLVTLYSDLADKGSRKKR